MKKKYNKNSCKIFISYTACWKLIRWAVELCGFGPMTKAALDLKVFSI